MGGTDSGSSWISEQRFGGLCATQAMTQTRFRRNSRGGYEPKMAKTEAALVFRVGPSANRNKITEAHRKLHEDPEPSRQR
uniref:Uncharacterized protein n=1 Tax=Amphilophus citrinellus TaxID=61819 RepID=A0A3Q0SWG9_AMPCI